MQLSAAVNKVFRGVENYICHDDAPKAGRPYNIGEGVGTMLMQGGAQAINLFNMAKTESNCLKAFVIRLGAVALGIITTPFTLSGAAVKQISSYFPHTSKIRTDAIIPRTDPDRIDQIYDLLQALKVAAAKVGLPFLMVSGTMLGARRHKGIIGWDDDGDTCIMKDQKHKMAALKAELALMGIDLVNYEDLCVYQIFYSNQKFKENYPQAKEKAQVDIFVWERMSDGKTTFAGKFHRSKWPREYFTDDDLKETKEWSFGPAAKGLTLPGIKEPDTYLKRYYGQDCLDYGMHSHKHIVIANVPFPVPVVQLEKVEIVDKQPAQGRNWVGPA